jgi:hypothetical protein
MSYVYMQTEPGKLTVGFFAPDGTWTAESDHGNPEDASKRTAWLNGDASRTEAEVPA